MILVSSPLNHGENYQNGFPIWYCLPARQGCIPNYPESHALHFGADGRSVIVGTYKFLANTCLGIYSRQYPDKMTGNCGKEIIINHVIRDEKPITSLRITWSAIGCIYLR